MMCAMSRQTRGECPQLRTGSLYELERECTDFPLTVGELFEVRRDLKHADPSEQDLVVHRKCQIDRLVQSHQIRHKNRRLLAGQPLGTISGDELTVIAVVGARIIILR